LSLLVTNCCCAPLLFSAMLLLVALWGRTSSCGGSLSRLPGFPENPDQPTTPFNRDPPPTPTSVRHRPTALRHLPPPRQPSRKPGVPKPNLRRSIRRYGPIIRSSPLRPNFSQTTRDSTTSPGLARLWRDDRPLRDALLRNHAQPRPLAAHTFDKCIEATWLAQELHRQKSQPAT